MLDLFANMDGYDTESVTNAKSRNDSRGSKRQAVETQMEDAKEDKLSKPRHRKSSVPVLLPPSCPPIHSDGSFVSCGPTWIDPTASKTHFHACQAIQPADVQKKIAKLHSLQAYQIVRKNPNLSANLATFETMVPLICSGKETPVARTVLTHIDELENMIFRLDSTCSAMAALNLAQKDNRTSAFWEYIVYFACIFFAVLYIVSQL